MNEDGAPARRADRPRPAAHVPFRRVVDAGLRGRHGRLRALRGRAEDVLALVQVPPQSRASLLYRPLPELHDERGRRPERARLRRAAARGRARAGAERLGEARPRRPERHGQGRWSFHAGRLLLPHDDPPAAVLAALREGPAEPRGARPRRRAWRALPALRRRASPRARARHRRRAGGPCRGARGGDAGAGSRAGGRGRAPSRGGARRCRGARACAGARDLGGRPRAGRLRDRALSLPRRAHHRRDRSARAAGRVPRQRSRRGDAAERGSSAHA